MHFPLACFLFIVLAVSAVRGCPSAQAASKQVAGGDPAAASSAAPMAADANQIRRRSGVRVAVPALNLIDSENNRVDLAAHLDQPDPVFVNFIFTSCPSVCPIMTQTFSELEQSLSEQRVKARLVSISIDPEYDTPEQLKYYAESFRKGKDWRFLTGTHDQSIAAQKAFDVYLGDKMAHPVAVFFRRAAGESWVRIDGFASADQLAAEVTGAGSAIEPVRR